MHLKIGQSHWQRHALSEGHRQRQGFAVRLALILALREEQYEPQACCPHCGRELTAVEILRGFSDDPHDFTTTCPDAACSARFEATIVMFSASGIARVHLQFYCEAQVLHHLDGLEHMTPLELSREQPSLYRSAIVHCGALSAAFAKIGISYPYEEISNWQAKVTPFLGKMTDKEIASCAGVKSVEVRRLRLGLGILRFGKRPL